MPESTSQSTNAGCGVALGGIAGAGFSYASNGSAGWAFIHMLFGWTCVLYACFFRSEEILPALRAMFGG